MNSSLSRVHNSPSSAPAAKSAGRGTSSARARARFLAAGALDFTLRRDKSRNLTP
jgi:hypothetical protein